MTADEVWTKLDALATSMEPEVRKAFLAALNKVKSELTAEELAEIARTGDIRPILDRLDLTDFKLAYRNSIIRAAGTSTSLPFDVRFDVLSYGAIRAIQQAELSLVSDLTQQIQDGIRQFLTDGIRNGVNPRDTAIEIREIIGLDTQGAQAVANYRRLLTGGQLGQPYTEALRRAGRDARFDRTILAAINDRSPLPKEQVDRMMRRYEERAVKRRAEMIARTNTIDALEVAHRLQWEQAITEGRVQESELRRFWHTARDERTCPICAAIPGLNPAGVAFGQPFLLPGGVHKMGPTVHPHCRCITFTKIVPVQKGAWDYNTLRLIAKELSGLMRAA